MVVRLQILKYTLYECQKWNYMKIKLTRRNKFQHIICQQLGVIIREGTEQYSAYIAYMATLG